jgi:hypothetical protein
MAKLDDANTTGFYTESITASAANGFEVGKSYTVYLAAAVEGVNDADSYTFTITASSGGTGARAVTITVNDGTNTLEHANVRVTAGSESFCKQTNASGVVLFSLDDASWKVDITLAGHEFTQTTLVVDGTETVTYSMTKTSFTPSTPGLVTGYLYVKDEAMAVEAGVPITCEMTAPPEDDTGVAYDSKIRTVTSAATTGLCQFTNLVKGGTYKFCRGADTSVGTFTRSLVATVIIPTNATSPYQIPSILGAEVTA